MHIQKDDSQLPSKSSPFLNLSYFLKSKMAQKPLPENILMPFFSQRHQQQSDYTCGPSALKMVADYYVSMVRRTFSGELIQQQAALKLLNSSTESEVSERVKTTEAVGSEIADMRNGLMALRLSVFDDCDGLSFSESSEQELYSHKAILWEKMKEILKLGIPIIINMRDKDEIGHYEIAIGIDDENIILAEPGAALSGEIQFESIPKNVFINRWKNMSGELHGRYLIISPNKASTEAIESILQDVPHYRNGQSVNKSQPLHEKARLNF